MSASGGASGLVVKLDNIAPATLPVNSSAAIFCLGSCFHRYEVVRDVEIIVDGVRHRPTAFRMPRADVVGCLRQGARSPGGSERSSLSGLEARGYRSGFWATIPVQTPARSGALELKLAACLATGSELISSLGRIEIVESEPTAALPRAAPSLPDGLIAICMATFEPDMDLFRVQLDSLRSQTDPRWLCVISDDCSSPRHFEEIKRAVGEDRRFVLSRSNIRLGFYRNFERALKMVPAEAELVAMCDQDDRWHPEKLEVLRSALGRARLVYSDQRLVDVGRARAAGDALERTPEQLPQFRVTAGGKHHHRRRDVVSPRASRRSTSVPWGARNSVSRSLARARRDGEWRGHVRRSAALRLCPAHRRDPGSSGRR